MHAALWLVVVLAGVAAQYILAAAEFVAVTQVLVYVGAVMVLFLFGIMLDPRPDRPRARPEQPQLGARHPGRRSCCSACSSYVIIDAFERRRRCPSRLVRRRPRRIADNVLSPYLVPFLALSFILLAAAIGAIVLARKD